MVVRRGNRCLTTLSRAPRADPCREPSRRESPSSRESRGRPRSRGARACASPRSEGHGWSATHCRISGKRTTSRSGSALRTAPLGKRSSIAGSRNSRSPEFCGSGAGRRSACCARAWRHSPPIRRRAGPASSCRRSARPRTRSQWPGSLTRPTMSASRRRPWRGGSGRSIRHAGWATPSQLPPPPSRPTD